MCHFCQSDFLNTNPPNLFTAYRPQVTVCSKYLETFQLHKFFIFYFWDYTGPVNSDTSNPSNVYGRSINRFFSKSTFRTKYTGYINPSFMTVHGIHRMYPSLMSHYFYPWLYTKSTKYKIKYRIDNWWYTESTDCTSTLYTESTDCISPFYLLIVHRILRMYSLYVLFLDYTRSPPTV